MNKYAPGPWEFENRPNQHDPSQAYCAVVDAEGRVIFDTANVGYRLAVVESHPDEFGNVYHQTGQAVESLKLAAHAPELLHLLGLIVAEFKSDPMSVQCFDLDAIVQPAITLVAKLEGR